MDEEGYVYILDRKKEMIKYRGYQIAPAELEAILMEHPAVLDCAVAGMPDKESGEIPKAFVVLREGAAARSGGVKGFCGSAGRPLQKNPRGNLHPRSAEELLGEDPAPGPQGGLAGGQNP